MEPSESFMDTVYAVQPYLQVIAWAPDSKLKIIQSSFKIIKLSP